MWEEGEANPFNVLANLLSQSINYNGLYSCKLNMILVTERSLISIFIHVHVCGGWGGGVGRGYGGVGRECTGVRRECEGMERVWKGCGKGVWGRGISYLYTVIWSLIVTNIHSSVAMAQKLRFFG